MRSLRELYRKAHCDGNARHKMRMFNLTPHQQGKAVSVKAFAESLGFSVTRCELPKGMSGQLVQDPFSENGYEIQINNRHSVQRQRWAVLHEMAHFYLHSDHSDPLAGAFHFDRSENAFYVDEREETEANEFAAVLLFGDGALAAAVGLHGRDTAKLANVFGVSEIAIRIALKQFL